MHIYMYAYRPDLREAVDALRDAEPFARVRPLALGQQQCVHLERIDTGRPYRTRRERKAQVEGAHLHHVALAGAGRILG